jgi:hypothetical protein
MMRSLRVIATFSAVIGLVSAGTPPVLAAASAAASTSPAFQERLVLPNPAGSISVQAPDSIEWLIPVVAFEETPTVNRRELPMQLDALVTSLKNLAQRVPNDRIERRLQRLPRCLPQGPSSERGRKLRDVRRWTSWACRFRNRIHVNASKDVQRQRKGDTPPDYRQRPLARVRPLRSGSEQPDGASAFQEPQELVDAADAEAIQHRTTPLPTSVP